MTRFARPAGSPLTAFTVCPTGCRQLSTPGRGFSSPRCVQYTKKKPVLSYELFFKYGGEGGLTRFARPAGSPLTAFTVCPTGCRQLSNPGRGFSSPRCVQYTKKKPVLSYELFFKYGGEGGFEPPIRCRIHTFQACSFSHSDTSPNCRSCLAGTGANLGKS